MTERTGLSEGPHIVEIDGLRQAYEVAGSGPVCVVHSGGPSVESGYLRIPPLEAHLTMVYLDPIGTGRSDRSPGGDYTMPVYARMAEGLIAHLRVDRPVFLGHSHGGFVGLELAIRHPGLLGGLIAYSTAPVYGPELYAEATRRMAAFAERWPDRPEAAEAARIWDAHVVAKTAKVTDRESFSAYLSGILPAYFADFRHTIAQRGPFVLEVSYDPARDNGVWDARGRLGAIDMPTLVVSGRHDFICPRPWAEQLHAEIPDARLLALDESGHFGHLEGQQEEFVRAVAEFAG